MTCILLRCSYLSQCREGFTKFCQDKKFYGSCQQPQYQYMGRVRVRSDYCEMVRWSWDDSQANLNVFWAWQCSGNAMVFLLMFSILFIIVYMEMIMQAASVPHQMCPLSTISRMLASTLLRISLIIINICLWPLWWSSLSPDVRMIVLLILRQQDVSARLYVLGHFCGRVRQLGRAQRDDT